MDIKPAGAQRASHNFTEEIELSLILLALTLKARLIVQDELARRKAAHPIALAKFDELSN